ncbi:hypothetical protein KW800_02325 [Candidatus Parcubacteria bacterium]|nr:hypothetical protein [Candidatus Parcubacteria bacterium]
MQHHAYLLIGERDEADEYLKDVFDESGISPVGNPDVFVISQDVFGVDDARELSDRAIEKAFGKGDKARKVFVIHANKFTSEAQNALLKTFEDPVANTHFFISARESSVFLPTLLSRLHQVRVGGELGKNKEVEKFLTKTLKQRIDFAKKFADEKEERGAGALALFLDSLLLKLRADGAPLEMQKKVLELRTYARDSGAMPRLILEHLALVL